MGTIWYHLIIFNNSFIITVQNYSCIRPPPLLRLTTPPLPTTFIHPPPPTLPGGGRPTPTLTTGNRPQYPLMAAQHAIPRRGTSSLCWKVYSTPCWHPDILYLGGVLQHLVRNPVRHPRTPPSFTPPISLRRMTLAQQCCKHCSVCYILGQALQFSISLHQTISSLSGQNSQ